MTQGELTPRRFAISLPREEQMCLYAELEILVQGLANEFLKQELQAQRVSLSSLRRVTKSWARRGRAQVIEFYFDLATQMELVYANIDTLHFHGNEASTAKRKIVLYNAWKDVARELAVHTFCAADSAVRKVFQDALIILDMLGATAPFWNRHNELHSIVVRNIDNRESMLAEHERRQVPLGIPQQIMPSTPQTSGPPEQTRRGEYER